MNRLFDPLLLDSDWTEGPDWESPNPAQNLLGIYTRRYTGEDGDDNYRLESGDNFYIGSNPSNLRDWRPRNTPLVFEINGEKGGEISFYFGLQIGEDDINYKLDKRMPYMFGAGELYVLVCDYHRFYGLKAKGFSEALYVFTNLTGLTVDGIYTDGTQALYMNNRYLKESRISNLTTINADNKFLDLGAGSSDVSIQDFSVQGTGDIGLKIRQDHSLIVVAGGLIVCDDHRYRETQELIHGLLVESSGNFIVARDIELKGFSGASHHFDCVAYVRDLKSYLSGAGIYFGQGGTAYGCMVCWTRQIDDLSYAYYAGADLELTNSGCLLDEVGGAAAILVDDGVTVTINGGDYQLKLPLPFITSLGTSTVILNNVTLNGTVFNLTLEFLSGDSWRGDFSPVTRDLIKVPNNMPVMFPHGHIPNLKDAISLQGSERPFEETLTITSGAKLTPINSGTIKYYADEAFLHLNPGEVAYERFRYSTEDIIYVHEIEITASTEVGATLAAPEDFSGTSWSSNGESFSGSNLSTNLEVAATLIANRVYQISVRVEELSNGSIAPIIRSGSETVTTDETHSVVGRRTWLLKAPANATHIGIAGLGFTGEVTKIYVRELIRTENAQVPTIKSLTQLASGKVLLVWRIPPVARLSDTITANKGATGVLDSSDKFGYRDTSGQGDFLFTDTTSIAKRSGISLRGGNSCEVYEHYVEGGYDENAENATWQTGFQNTVNSGPYFEQLQLCFLTVDLALNSNKGKYSGLTNNSDCILINGRGSEESMRSRTWGLGLHLKNSSDGVIDSKQHGEWNLFHLEAGYKQFRAQPSGLSILCNGDLVQGEESRYAIGPANNQAVVFLWNMSIDDIPVESKSQMANTKKDADFHFQDRGQIGESQAAIHILHSYPSLSDYGRVAATSLEFQIRTDNGSWVPFEVKNTETHNFRGSMQREITLPTGQHEIRCRSWNGANLSAWSNTGLITI